MAKIKHIRLPRSPYETLPARPEPLVGTGEWDEAPDDEELTEWQRRKADSEWFGPRFSPLTWKPMPYMEEFLTELYARERKHDYVRMVRVALSHFAAFMAGQDPPVKHPEQIERIHLLHFQAWLQTEARTEEGNPFSVSYRRKLMCYLRSWILWLLEEEHIEHNPWRRIKVPKTPKQPKPLEDDEIAMLFECHRRQAYSMSPFAWHRQEVILVLLYGWGLRIHELASLNLSQMDLRLNVVKIKNKGSERPKPLPYTDTIKQTVQRYLVWRAREAEDGEEALLVEATHGGRLSIDRIREVVRTLGERAGVNINPHRLRDSFGTVMVNGGAEIEHVQVMMGHSKREMTMAYSLLADKRVAETHRQIMSPILDQLMGEAPGLPDDIDEPPPGWPKHERTDD